MAIYPLEEEKMGLTFRQRGYLDRLCELNEPIYKAILLKEKPRNFREDGDYLARALYDGDETAWCSVCHVVPGGMRAGAYLLRMSKGVGRE